MILELSKEKQALERNMSDGVGADVLLSCLALKPTWYRKGRFKNQTSIYTYATQLLLLLCQAIHPQSVIQSQA